MELSIYSTCKRISQKLLRNVKKFLDLIYTELDIHPFKVIRSNCEELMIQGPESRQDIRMVNSYPSKVMRPSERAHDAMPLLLSSAFFAPQLSTFMSDSGSSVYM